IYLVLLAVLTAAGPALAQDPPIFDRPGPYVPLQPSTREDLDERQALHLYTLGLLCQREDRLLEATRAFEQAAKLTPGAAAIHRALIPLYLAVDDGAAALAATRKVLELDPEDYDTWHTCARQLRAQGNLKEACAALRRGLTCKRLKEVPELAQQMFHDLGALH